MAHSGGNFFENIGNDVANFFSPKPPKTDGPSAPPTLGEAANQATAEQLKKERRMAMTSDYLSPGASLQDQQVQTTSQILIGS